MKYLKSKWTAAVAVVVAIALFAAFTMGRNDSPQYFTAKAERGDIHDVVEATGTINAVTTVQVGSQVSGTISKLYADFNSKVTKGQVIAEIDPSLFQGALLQAKADYQNAVANSANAKAELLKAQAAAEQAKSDYARNQALAQEGVISRQALDVSKAANDSAAAAVSAAQAQVVQAQAQTKQKSAAVDVAQTNMNYTIIHAPIDGTVTARNVDVGQTVAASLQAPVLFSIAQDLTKMQVYAKTDESDVGQIRAGQKITFKVDAFPKNTFTGVVAQVRMNPTTVQNVVTYDTVINFDNPEMKLFPGMTAYVTIPVAEASNVVKVPNAALRFTPDLKPQQAREIAQKYGISLGGKNKASASAGDTAGAQAQQRTKPADSAIVWKLAANKSLQPVQIKMGITDHTFTEVSQAMKGQLNAGDELVIGSAAAGQKSASATAAPGMGRMGR